MKHNLIKIFAVLSFMLILTSPTQAATVKSTTAPNLAAMPLMFIEQQPNRYQVQLNGQSMWFTQNEMWLTIAPSPESGEGRGEGKNIKLTFQDSNPQARLEPLSQLEMHLSNFRGNDPTKWQTDIPVYSGVRYHDVYPNTDLIITSEQGKLAWQWETTTVGAGLVPARVADSQTGQAQGLPLPGHVRVSVDNGHTAQTLTLDPNQSLTDQLAAIIDPQTADSNANPHLPRQQGAAALVFSTFLGGSGSDYGKAIALDTAGNIYVTGSTASTSFPTTAGGYDASYNGDASDVFVAKFNNSGTSLIYATFLGGSNDDEGRAMGVDSNGNVYVTGYTTSSNFPTTAGAYDTTYGGIGDAFVIKLNSSGSTLSYATFLGGSSDDGANAMTLDSLGNVYLTGSTKSSSFPTTVGAYDTTYNGSSGNFDAFIAKLNSSGSALSYGTFLGGTLNDRGRAIALDSAGNIYVTGPTSSTNFPATTGAYATSNSGGSDVFVAKLNSSGSSLTYATYLGSSGTDESYGMALDSAQNVYLTGFTWENNFPVTFGVYDVSYNGGQDVFVAKLNNSGATLDFATYLGSWNNDEGQAIALDSAGNIYVTGFAGTGTGSVSFPTTVGAYDTTQNGADDVFIAKLNNSGTTLSYSTFLGYNSYDNGTAIALDNNGNVYVTGKASSAYTTSEFPVTAGAYDVSYNGGGDVFVAKLAIGEISSCGNVTEIPQAECQELVTLYNSTNGPGWTNKTGWLVTNTPCSWYGITCSAGHVSEINFQNNQLSGAIPNFTNLPNLQRLDLSSNKLSGPIPNFSNLFNLTELSLSVNQLSGSVPNFSNLPNLTELYLGWNQLSGSVPDFSNLPNLTDLDLYSNQLSGSVPNFSNLPNLTRLDLGYNQLSGGVPNFSNLPNLESLNLSYNQLSGSVPNFSNLPNLTGLYLHSNQLSGGVPNFSNLPNLQSLFLYSNQLNGSVPNFSNLPNLTGLYLHSNQLSGGVPNFSNLPNLQSLFLSNNQLRGTIPNMNWSSFQTLQLNNNCGLVAFDAAQTTVLSSKDPNWQQVNPSCQNTAPTTPGLDVPVNNYVATTGNAINFKWSAAVDSTLPQGKLFYSMQIFKSATPLDNTTLVTGIGFYGTNVNGGGQDYDGLTFNWTPSQAGNYYWRVYAFDGALGSAWSDLRHVEVKDPVANNTAPLIPAFKAPLEGASFNLGNAVTFEWNAAQDDGLPEAKIRYSVQVATDTSFADNTIVTGTGYYGLSNAGGGQDQYGLSFTWSPTQAGTYYWRLYAFDGALGSGWSTPKSLVIKGNVYTISGKVVDYVGNPIAGATLLLNDKYIVMSQSDGTYNFNTFKDEIFAGTYTLRLYLTDYTFTPEKVSLTVSSNTQQDFMGFAPNTVYGQVKDMQGNPVSGVTVKAHLGLLSTASNPTTSEGKYVLSLALPASYSLAAYKTGELFFEPESYSVSMPSSSPIRKDFTLLETLPLVFIPGVMGSYLYRDGSEVWPDVTLTSNKIYLSLYPAYSKDSVYATDVTRIIGNGVNGHGDTIVYEPLLNYLHAKGFVEYQVDNDPARRTEDYCDYNAQKDNHPNLFVFAYDWRRSNAESAKNLEDYVGCIKKFFPNQKINILTHSMGGLVARRYILSNPNDVNALVSIAAPWLGAPKLLYATETGDLTMGGGGWIQTAIVTQLTAKKVVRASQGGYQLLPSKAYFDLWGTDPVGEDGVDLNGNGKKYDTLNYADYVNFVDKHYQCGKDEGCNDQSTIDKFKPGTIGQSFHSGGQDDWQNDNTNIKYYHLYGVTSKRNTIAKLVFKRTFCQVNHKNCYNKIDLKYTRGDGTVPCHSATRRSGGCDLSGTNYNAPNAQVHRFDAGKKSCKLGFDTCTDDSVAEHTSMTQNPKVQERVWQSLYDSAKPASMRSQIVAQQEEPLPPVEMAYYLTLLGVDNVIVSDVWGNNTAPIPDTDLRGTVPEVSSYIVGENATSLVMPTDRALTVTFKVLTQPIGIILDKGDAITATQVIRYLETTLPAGVTAMLLFNEQGVATLQYDSNGDNIFESTVQPTVNVNGTTPLDITEPTVTIEANSANLVTVKAVDSESGIKTVYYSLDGTNFQPYTQSVPVTSREDSTFYAFADDNMANRSSLASYDLTGISAGHIYLPLIIKASQDSSTNHPIVK